MSIQEGHFVVPNTQPDAMRQIAVNGPSSCHKKYEAVKALALVTPLSDSVWNLPAYTLYPQYWMLDLPSSNAASVPHSNGLQLNFLSSPRKVHNHEFYVS